MAHILGFQVVSIDGGTESVDLMAWANSFVTTYTPTPPREAADGTFSNVTETIELMFAGATSPAMQVAITRIERFLALARERKATGAGARIYLHFRPDQDTNNWRSEILSGSISYTDRALYAFGQGKVEARITITRLPYFEGNESFLLLTSKANPSSSVGTRTIHNRHDSTGGNYIDIPAGRVLGSLPTPAKISLKNTTDTFGQHRSIYIGSTGLTNAAAYLSDVMEGEDALAYNVTSDVETVGPTASNLQVLNVPLPGATVTTRHWVLDRQMVSAVNGRSVRFFVRLTSATGGPAYMTATLKNSDGSASVSPDGDEIRLITVPTFVELHDLGSFRFPVTDSASSTSLRLQISFRSTATANVKVDYIMPFVSAGNGIRHLINNKTTLPINCSLVDDAPRNKAYQHTAAGLEDSCVSVRGAPVMLYPSDIRMQRIFFLMDFDPDAPVHKSLQVEIRYRPRRLTL